MPLLKHVPVVAFDSGPCGGKDDCIAPVREFMVRAGYHPIFAPEVSTMLMKGNMRPDTGIFPARTYQRTILSTMKQLEAALLQAARECGHDKPIVFLNRAMPSSKAYTPDIYADLLAELGLGTEREVLLRYDAVILLRSLAVGLPELYEILKSNNPERRESVAQARALDDAIVKAYEGHPNLFVIGNETDWEGKLHRAFGAIRSTLNLS